MLSRRRLRYFYLRFIRLRATPAEMARGVAVGVFAGMFPAFGLQTIVSVLLAALIRGNKVAAAAATWISNPLTYVPFYAFNFQVGRWLLGADSVSFVWDGEPSLSQFFQLGYDFLVVIMLGSLVVGTLAAIASYGITFPLVRYVRQQRRRQRPPLVDPHHLGH